MLLLASLWTAAGCADPNGPERVGALELTTSTEYLDVGQALALSARAADASGATPRA
ncbi:MAG: hypothetical protein M3P24_08810 [Gemmatimonadota bacterium]|nr:hypothetical protein [Gemmatimonadota bacterium]